MSITMKESQLQTILSLIATIIAAYIGFLLLRDLGTTHQGIIAWWGSTGIQPTLITVFISSSLLSALIIAFLIFKGSRSWVFIPLIAHVVLSIVGLPSTIMLLVVIIWWFSKYAYKAT